MPVTPFHFGPGALLKALAPRHVSFTAFCTAQVLIDLESGYHLVRGDWPVHRELHSFVLATLTGVLGGIVTWFVAGRLQRARPMHRDVERTPALIGGAIGGLSHPVLDGVMHTDLLPLWPLSDDNPFFEAVDLGALHLACVVCGAMGILVLKLRSRSAP